MEAATIIKNWLDNLKKSFSCCSSVDLFLSIDAKQHLALAFLQNMKGRPAVDQACHQTSLKASLSQICCISHICEPSSLLMPSRTVTSNLSFTHDWFWTVDSIHWIQLMWQISWCNYLPRTSCSTCSTPGRWSSSCSSARGWPRPERREPSRRGWWRRATSSRLPQEPMEKGWWLRGTNISPYWGS